MRAVLFDLGNTLVSYYTAPDFAPILRKCLHGCCQILEPNSRIDEDQLFQRALTLNVERPDHAVWPLIQRLGLLFDRDILDPATQEALTTAFLEPIFATAVPDPDALSTLVSLRAAGFATAIVSNTPWGTPSPPWRVELARHNLLTAVDVVVFCVDVGYRKPHRAPFERALSLLCASATEAVFVGDDPRWDVAGAEASGIHPILLAPTRPDLTPERIPIARSLADVLTHVTHWRDS